MAYFFTNFCIKQEQFMQATQYDLLNDFVPAEATFKRGSLILSKSDYMFGKRLIILVNWSAREVCLSFVDGQYNPTHVQDGTAQVFDIKFLFDPNPNGRMCRTFSDGHFNDHTSLKSEYENHILDKARKAQELLTEFGDENTLNEQIRNKVNSILKVCETEYYQ